ncbi:unnamed protein product [Lactuca saligna]|uniref:Uncharacterized protein n=1 Tax=Lactuca saligna TaxID=75948 RepID=A0AA35YHB2_LACSI|nr:unnamed protein product [Lactuca saligna]
MGARWFVARVAIGGGLRDSTRVKKEKDRCSEAAVTLDEKKETKKRGCSSSVLEGVAKGGSPGSARPKQRRLEKIATKSRSSSSTDQGRTKIEEANRGGGSELPKKLRRERESRQQRAATAISFLFWFDRHQLTKEEEELRSTAFV